MSVDPPRPPLLSLNALRAFEAAARHESFARAASELHVTAAAVAQQVRTLEAWAGAPFAVRLPSRSPLTLLVPEAPEPRSGLAELIEWFRAEAGAGESCCAAGAD